MDTKESNAASQGDLAGDLVSAPGGNGSSETSSAPSAELAGGTPPEADDKGNEKAKKSIKARVLVDGEHGKVNDVVTLSESAAKAAQKSNQVDTSAEAVAYAESLKS